MKQFIILVLISLITSFVTLAYGSENSQISLNAKAVTVSDSGDHILVKVDLPTPCTKNLRASFTFNEREEALELHLAAEQYLGMCATVIVPTELAISDVDVQTAVNGLNLNPDACYSVRDTETRFQTELCLGKSNEAPHSDITFGGIVTRSGDGRVNVVLPKLEFVKLEIPPFKEN